MIWRSAILAGYVALAIVVGVAYGGQGLVVLFFFYVWAGAWGAFFLVWGWAAREAGRWNVRRLERAVEEPEPDETGRPDGDAVPVPAPAPVRAEKARRPAPAL